MSKTKFVRTCIVCRRRDDRSHLLRLRLELTGVVSEKAQNGRGFWVHLESRLCCNTTKVESALLKKGVKFTCVALSMSDADN